MANSTRSATKADKKQEKLTRGGLHADPENKDGASSSTEDNQNQRDPSTDPEHSTGPVNIIAKDQIPKGSNKDGTSPKKPSDKVHSTGLSSWQMVVLIILGAVVIACSKQLTEQVESAIGFNFASFYNSNLEPAEPDEKRLKNEEFVSKMSSIISMLKNTQSNLKFVNRSLTIFITEDKPEKPAIVLLMGTNSSTCALCICMWKFVEALKTYYNDDPPSSGHITQADLADRDENDKKAFIEDSIDKVVRSNNHIIIFDDVELYSNSTLSKMHTYLDHENAPHRNVVYILTSTIADGFDVEADNSLKLTKTATKHFDDRWSHYDKDHRRALMGRMTSVVGLIHKGKLNEFVESKYIDVNIKQKCENKCKI